MDLSCMAPAKAVVGRGVRRALWVMGRRWIAVTSCVVLLATLVVNDSARNATGMLLHDLLCHRETWTYRLCHENPTVLAFWD
eukprot:7339927-Prymnesium_polylepis.1